jgi:hypothetical protein
VAVEREGSIDSAAPHQRERDGVGEAHALIGKLLEQTESLSFNRQIRPKYLECTRIEYVSAPTGGERGSGPSREKRQSLVQNKIACDERFARPLELLPTARRSGVELIVSKIPGDERTGIDEDHGSSS